jgi:hypothetical protein
VWKVVLKTEVTVVKVKVLTWIIDDYYYWKGYWIPAKEQIIDNFAVSKEQDSLLLFKV